jgi:hypothetical protein
MENAEEFLGIRISVKNVGVTTMERLDQGHLHPSIKHLKTDMSLTAFRRALYQRAVRTAYRMLLLSGTFTLLC